MPNSGDLVATLAAETVRTDFVPRSGYISPQFAQLEYERMWPRVWHVACREEELKTVGSYVVFDIGRESIIIVRTAADRIKAYYNVCQHRGRRLMEGHGSTRAFVCRYHGWQWNLDGANTLVLDRSDWDGCPEMSAADIRLKEPRVDVWAGFVFINMDENAESLQSFLDPVPDYLDPFQIEKMRYRWYMSVRTPCNWKVATEAFVEGYHVWSTHPQNAAIFDDAVTRGHVYGKHGNYDAPNARPLGAPSSRSGKPVPVDLRQGIVDFYKEFETTLKAIFSERDTQAATRLLTEVPADAPLGEVLTKLMQFQKEAAEACGAGWPPITFDQQMKAGADWHIFPNLVILPYPDGALVYRALPDGSDPDSCIFDIWSLVRYAPGSEPVLERQMLRGPDDWMKVHTVSKILQQDFENMGRVQAGMYSRGFRGARTNPLQEPHIANFHDVLRGYLFD